MCEIVIELSSWTCMHLIDPLWIIVLHVAWLQSFAVISLSNKVQKNTKLDTSIQTYFGKNMFVLNQLVLKKKKTH